jgi:hypothetical protein
MTITSQDGFNRAIVSALAAGFSSAVHGVGEEEYRELIGDLLAYVRRHDDPGPNPFASHDEHAPPAASGDAERSA